MRRDFSPGEVLRADVLVVGGGVAGMSAALHAKGRHVILVGKTGFAEGGSSVHAQGGIAAAVGAVGDAGHVPQPLGLGGDCAIPGPGAGGPRRARCGSPSWRAAERGGIDRRTEGWSWPGRGPTAVTGSSTRPVTPPGSR